MWSFFLFLLNKIERVQIRGIKWILSQQYTTYTANNYFEKCKELNFLPLRLRLDFFAILLFHKILNKTVPIELPAYISLAPETNLRSSHRDPLTFLSSVKPRITRKVTHNKKCLKTRGRNVKSVKTKVKKVKRKKKKAFKKYRARENIYIDDNSLADDFRENKVLTTSFFYKTHIQWNNLPLEVKIIENYDTFKIKLEEHLWDNIMVGEDQDDDDMDVLGLPGD